jgi:hypothetical protein
MSLHNSIHTTNFPPSLFNFYVALIFFFICILNPVLFCFCSTHSIFFFYGKNINLTFLVPKVNTVRPITKNPQNKGGDAGRLDELTNQIAEFKVFI